MRQLMKLTKGHLGGVAAAILSLVTLPAHAISIPYMLQDIVNTNDVTFNQELGINSAGEIAGYFGSGAMGHPNKGYTTLPPYSSFTNENFFTVSPPVTSAQTQVTGINNAGVTVGFWSDTNMGVGLDNNFGWVNVGGTFTNVNHAGGPTTGLFTDQLLGVNNSNIAVGFYVDAGGVTHGYTYNIAAESYSTSWKCGEKLEAKRCQVGASDRTGAAWSA
jgi:hypothetical protein